MKKLLSIINSKSGTGNQSKAPALIERTIDHSRFQVVHRFVNAFGDPRRFAAQAASEGYHGVLAVGGDGTVNGAAEGLTGTSTALAVIPCGSGNGLARHLNIPMNIERAVQVVNQDHIEPVDYCTLNGVPFMCTCGLGFDAQVASKFQEKPLRGPVSYVQTTVEQFVRYKPQHVTLTLDGKPLEVDAFLVACCNTAQYGNNGFISPHASVQDGLIDVTVITPFRLIDVPSIGLRLFFKRIDENHHVNIFRAREVQIHRDAPGKMHIDGDPVDMPADVTVTCHHGGINMFLSGKGENNAPKEVGSF